MQIIIISSRQINNIYFKSLLQLTAEVISSKLWHKYSVREFAQIYSFLCRQKQRYNCKHIEMEKISEILEQPWVVHNTSGTHFNKVQYNL